MQSTLFILAIAGLFGGFCAAVAQDLNDADPPAQLNAGYFCTVPQLTGDTELSR